MSTFKILASLIGLLLFASALLPFFMSQQDIVRLAASSTVHSNINIRPANNRKEHDLINDVLLQGSNFHFVVSSDCSPFQRWQVLTQIHSAINIGQSGRYTWIMSGCSPEENDEANKARQKKNDKKSKAHGQDGSLLSRSSVLADIETHFPSLCGVDNNAAEGIMSCPSVHFSPDFSNMSVYGGPYADGKKRREYRNSNGKVTRSSYGNTYRFNNKPNGLRHWAETGTGGIHQGETSSFDPNADEAIVLIDPDFLFLRQFDLPNNVTVTPGKPAGADYSLGDQWLGFNRTAICGPKSQCVRTTKDEVYKYYSAGPPYIIHAHDVLRLASRWSELVPPTYDQYPLLYAEMFAYSMAAADLDLKHVLINDLFTGCMTRWPQGDMKVLATSAQRFIDTFDSSTEDIVMSSGGVKSCFVDDLEPPPMLHYCQRYPFRLNDGAWRVLAKRRVSHDCLDCTHDEVLLPWQDEGKDPSPKGFERNREEYWHALGVCAVVRGVAYAKKIGCTPR